MNEIEYSIPPVIVEDVVSSLADAIAEHVGWQIKSWMCQKLHELGVLGKGVKVGVGDTGVSRAHLTGDLSGVVKHGSFVGDNNPFDRNSHGSHCLSIVGGRRDDSGMLGYAPECEMVSAKVLSDRGSGGSNGIAAGIDWMREQGCSIISLSLGSPQASGTILSAIRRAHEANVIVFAAAGNDGRNNSIDEPARSGECIPVGAVNSSLGLASFSDKGRQLEQRGVVAGGVNVYGCFSRGYGSMSGTSMATPGAAGQCALLQSCELMVYGEIKTNNWHKYLDKVNKHSVDLGPKGDDTAFGNGAFDVYNACMEILNDKPGEPEPEPEPEWNTIFEGEGLRLQKKS